MEKPQHPCIAITGGARGIGLAIAKTFAARGFSVAAAARSAADLDAMQQHWRSHFPGQALYTLPTDLAEAEGVAQFARLLQQPPCIPLVLAHNVGAFAPGGLEAPPDQLERFLAINLLAADRLTRHILPLMQAAGQGHIITIGSVAVYDFPPGVDNYSISKYALAGWHRGLEQQLAHSPLHATIIHPGATYTRSWEGSGVDPATLLPAEAVAEAAWQAWQSRGAIREMQLRPPVL
jgi:NAD(P)-dependent dehydrogenase (short-subunit alcohol dehydrogenase family)